jgi:hypothetical protein
MDYGTSTKDIGFKIYDIQLKKAIYEINLEEMRGGYMQSDVMIFAASADGNHLTYYVFSSHKEVLYKRTFENAELTWHKRFDKEGAVFVVIPDRERLEEYNKYFTVVKNK